MSSWIGVYGNNKTELDWMRSNYQEADARFRSIHPVFESGDGRFEHGVDESGLADSSRLKFQYYWTIPCHWDEGEHFKQTEKDIKFVLRKLRGPKKLEIYLS